MCEKFLETTADRCRYSGASKTRLVACTNAATLMREGREPKAKPRLSNTPNCSRAPLTADFFNTIDSSRTSSKRPRKSWLSSPIMKMLWDAPPPEMICRIRMLPPLRGSRGLLWINSSYDPRFRKSRTRPIRLSPDNGVADIAALRICAMRQTSSLLSTRNQSWVIRRLLPRKADFPCFEHCPDLEHDSPSKKRGY